MPSETNPESTPSPSPAKLISLHSLPVQSPEPTGSQTPPLQTPVSIPFQWEEAPGKPREDAPVPNLKPKAIRSLDLPPARQGNEDKLISNSPSPSPTTVLDGPDFGRGMVTHTLSFSFGKLSFRSPEGGLMGSSRRQIGKDVVGNGSHRWNFSSWRWGRNEVADGGNLDFLKSVIVDEEDGLFDQVHGDSVSSSSTRKKTKRKASHFLANIYESFKQVVPWRKNKGSLTKQRT
ncbi:uncharacterized protein LOC124910259 [Impatiens glandulifera]|uniref:uncharacterized protein LOC124910259 n=1 Tax=Impatiens glandulifera TaxID=253017 RepID=UPI001FB1675B|nr:uncharacterized protein LOC124910259 [Impatiens glandulifera]